MMAVHLTKLQFFEDGYGQLAVELGLISPSSFMRFIHYKVFKDFMEDGYPKSTAIQLTADRTKASFSTVWRSVQYFQ